MAHNGTLLGIIMVLIRDGKSETGVHVMRNLYYFIKNSDNRLFFLRHACATCPAIPSNISTMGIMELTWSEPGGGINTCFHMYTAYPELPSMIPRKSQLPKLAHVSLQCFSQCTINALHVLFYNPSSPWWTWGTSPWTWAGGSLFAGTHPIRHILAEIAD